MNETILFVWGVVATLVAIGPLTLAGFLDWRAKKSKSTIPQ